jgi:hypothetical protein
MCIYFFGFILVLKLVFAWCHYVNCWFTGLCLTVCESRCTHGCLHLIGIVGLLVCVSSCVKAGVRMVPLCELLVYRPVPHRVWKPVYARWPSFNRNCRLTGLCIIVCESRCSHGALMGIVGLQACAPSCVKAGGCMVPIFNRNCLLVCARGCGTLCAIANVSAIGNINVVLNHLW